MPEFPPRLPRSFQWELKEWRKPDMSYEFGMIWYGPAGDEGDVATEVEWSDWEAGVFSVSEYQDATGLIERVDPDFSILKGTVGVGTYELARELVEQGHVTANTVKETAETILDRPEIFARWAASMGVAKLAYWGGDEEYVERLPYYRRPRARGLF
jgi:hypothetical protein